MKIFGLEIRKVNNKPQPFKKSGFFGVTDELPPTTINLFYSLYRKNSDCRRCIQEIQNGTAIEGYYIERNEAVIEDKEIDEIMKFGHGYRKIMSKIIRDVSVAGNAYIVKLRNDSGKIIGLDTIDPRSMYIVSDKYGTVTSYNQRINGEIKNTYEPQDIVNCFDEFDPDNELFGLSIMEGIVLDVMSDKESGLTNYHYFKNNGLPSRIFLADSSSNTEDLQNALDQLKKNFGGGKNAGKVGILKGLTESVQMQDSFKDMQFEVLRNFNTNRICSAFGVPKIILGYTDGVNYANGNNQFKKFIDNTILPREKNLENWLGQALEIGSEFRLRNSSYDDTLEKVQVMEIKQKNGRVTPNENRQALGYEESKDEMANELLISKGYDRLNDVGLSSEIQNTDES